MLDSKLYYLSVYKQKKKSSNHRTRRCSQNNTKSFWPGAHLTSPQSWGREGSPCIDPTFPYINGKKNVANLYILNLEVYHF